MKKRLPSLSYSKLMSRSLREPDLHLIEGAQPGIGDTCDAEDTLDAPLDPSEVARGWRAGERPILGGRVCREGIASAMTLRDETLLVKVVCQGVRARRLFTHLELAHLQLAVTAPDSFISMEGRLRLLTALEAGYSRLQKSREAGLIVDASNRRASAVDLDDYLWHYRSAMDLIKELGHWPLRDLSPQRKEALEWCRDKVASTEKFHERLEKAMEGVRQMMQNRRERMERPVQRSLERGR